MQGRRPPMPPYGWPAGEEPRPSWRKMKEGRADREPPAARYPPFRRSAVAFVPPPPEAEAAVESSAGVPDRRDRRRASLARFRARERSGRSFYRTEHDDVDLEELLRGAGQLGADDDDHAAVEAALQRLVDFLIAEHKAKA
jgi:hypothetical protein